MGRKRTTRPKCHYKKLLKRKNLFQKGNKHASTRQSDSDDAAVKQDTALQQDTLIQVDTLAVGLDDHLLESSARQLPRIWPKSGIYGMGLPSDLHKSPYYNRLCDDDAEQKTDRVGDVDSLGTSLSDNDNYTESQSSQEGLFQETLPRFSSTAQSTGLMESGLKDNCRPVNCAPKPMLADRSRHEDNVTKGTENQLAKQMSQDESLPFLSSLASYLQYLCGRHITFDTSTVVTGQLYVSVDNGDNTEFIINEKVCTNRENRFVYTSNSGLSVREDFSTMHSENMNPSEPRLTDDYNSRREETNTGSEDIEIPTDNNICKSSVTSNTAVQSSLDKDGVAESSNPTSELYQVMQKVARENNNEPLVQIFEEIQDPSDLKENMNSACESTEILSQTENEELCTQPVQNKHSKLHSRHCDGLIDFDTKCLLLERCDPKSNLSLLHPVHCCKAEMDEDSTNIDNYDMSSLDKETIKICTFSGCLEYMPDSNDTKVDAITQNTTQDNSTDDGHDNITQHTVEKYDADDIGHFPEEGMAGVSQTLTINVETKTSVESSRSQTDEIQCCGETVRNEGTQHVSRPKKDAIRSVEAAIQIANPSQSSLRPTLSRRASSLRSTMKGFYSCMADTTRMAVDNDGEKMESDDICSKQSTNVELPNGESRQKTQISSNICKIKLVKLGTLGKHRFEVKYQCQLCFRNFPDMKCMKGHLRQNHRRCDVCGEKHNKFKNMLAHREAAHTKVKHTYNKCCNCCICQKEFRNVSSFEIHKRKHTGERPYSCNKCKLSFISKKSLGSHRCKCVKESKMFFCENCHNAFSSKMKLSYHKTHHCSEKDQSLKTFCEVCHKYVNDIKIHNRWSHGEKKYGCYICEKAFISPSLLEQHMMSHTKPYSCDICGKTFGSPTIYERHMRIHIGQEQYQCEMCNKKFSRRDNLFRHLQAHAGLRRFKCVKCEKCFTRKSCLDRHAKRMHK